MPDLAETSIEFIDLPVYEGFASSIDEAQIEFIGAGGEESTIPVVSAVTPAPGTEITRETAISFNVTDEGGNLEHTNVCVYYPSLQRFEVLFYAAISGSWGARAEGFGPQYTGTRTPIANGFAFTDVIRRNGWPAPPVLVIDPADDAGNEAV